MKIDCSSCLLRPLELADASSLARHANDRGVWENLRDRFPHPYSEADATAYIEHLATRPVQTSFGIDVAAYPTIARIEQACLALPEFDAARPENQPDAPVS